MVEVRKGFEGLLKKAGEVLSTPEPLKREQHFWEGTHRLLDEKLAGLGKDHYPYHEVLTRKFTEVVGSGKQLPASVDQFVEEALKNLD